MPQQNSDRLTTIRQLLSACTATEQEAIFRELRAKYSIHPFEQAIGAPAEMILEAVHRAPELMRRMLRGVIADAAFRQFILIPLRERGIMDTTPEGNFAFDYKIDDGRGPVTIQVKLQRSEKGKPVVRSGKKYGRPQSVHIVETQRTRTGKDGDDLLTRPYRYGDFDILAVSMQPSTGKWDRYLYTLARWLLPGRNSGEIATLQPVSMQSDESWTDSLQVVLDWFHKSATDPKSQEIPPGKE